MLAPVNAVSVAPLASTDGWDPWAPAQKVEIALGHTAAHDADASHAAGQQQHPQHIILTKQQQHSKSYSDVGYCRRDLYDKCKLIMPTSGHPVGLEPSSHGKTMKGLYNPPLGIPILRE